MPRSCVKDRWAWHLTCNSRGQESEMGDPCSKLASQFSHSYEVYVQQRDLASNKKVNSDEENLLSSALGFCIHVTDRHTHTSTDTWEVEKRKRTLFYIFNPLG